MPIIKSARKAIRSSERKKVFNTKRKVAFKLAVKKIQKFVTEGKLAEAEKFLPEAYKAIDKAAKRGVIKKNNASRKKSLLVRMIRRKE